MVEYSQATRKVFALANQEAQRMNREYLGTEHILLGLVKSRGWGLSEEFCNKFGLEVEKLRTEISKLVEDEPTDIITMGKLPQTPRTKRAIGYATDFVGKRKGDVMTPYDIFYGLLEEGVASQVLVAMGLRDGIKQSILEKYVVENDSANTSNFWPVPRNKMSIIEYLRFAGGFMCDDERNVQVRQIKGGGEVVATYEVMPDGREEVAVIYSPRDFKQIKEALKARDFLEKANVQYKEVPRREEAAEQLRAEISKQIGQVISNKGLVDLVEGKQ